MKHTDLRMRKGYSRGRMGYYKIGANISYFRSEWEANYALYLEAFKKDV